MKAIALISGGLDSILAAKLIKDQDIDVIPLHFKTPFFHNDKKSLPADGDRLSWVKGVLGRAPEAVDISVDFLSLFNDPKHGFGSCLNPCIDCKILMLRKTKELLREFDAAFVITGEVLAQRPMSQHRAALFNIETDSGLSGLLLRPLSAKFLAPTIPEKEGWVARDRLLAFNGRSRRPQIDLADKLNIRDYAWPAGGCLLTDREFSRKLKDLIAHQDLTIDNTELLKLGRHFRVSQKAKLVVGRNEKENMRLINLAKDNDYLFMPGQDVAGPTALGRGEFNDQLLRLSCGITCRYCDVNTKSHVNIFYQTKKMIDSRLNGCPFLSASAVTEAELLSLKI